MIYPKFLKKGDTIGVPAPSSGSYDAFNNLKIKNAIYNIEKMGYNLVISDNIYNCIKGRSASAEIRGKEINDMFSNKNIDFITSVAGGSFLVECLPYINFENVVNNPKFFQGFSDPTGIIFPLTTKYDIATIYGKNFGNYGIENYSRDIKENLKIISGNLIEQNSYEKYEEKSKENAKPTDGYNLTEKVSWKVLNSNNTVISGRVMAGCFDVIVSIAGTKYDGAIEFCDKYKNDGIVWIFDICGLSKEEIICYLWQLNEMGYFKYATGILFGRCGENITFYDYTMEEALKDSVVAKLGIPIVYDIDVTHKKPSMTIINGSIVNISVENGKGKIQQLLL